MFAEQININSTSRDILVSSRNQQQEIRDYRTQVCKGSSLKLYDMLQQTVLLPIIHHSL